MVSIKKQRLDKIVADAGIGTRRETRRLIHQGHVTVDGTTVLQPGTLFAPGQHHIEVKDVPIRQHRLTLMMNKPLDVVTAHRDAMHETVFDLIPPGTSRRLMAAGRLDRLTEGMLIITEDGDLCHHLISPGRGVEKQYIAWVEGDRPDDVAARFHAGMVLADGTKTLPAAFQWIDDERYAAYTATTPEEIESSSLQLATVTVQEGKYHQVRRMFAACQLHVVHLKRIRVGHLFLDPHLQPGAFREISDDEMGLLIAGTPLP